MNTKRERLLARAREIEDRLERLAPDIDEGDLRTLVDEAWSRMNAVRKALDVRRDAG